MATRAKKKIDFAHISTYTVASAKTVTKGFPVIFSGSDTEIEDAGANSDLLIGVALNGGAAGERVQVLHPAPIVPMKCGTGGTTRGKKQKMAADGVFDAPAHDSSGATDDSIVGIAMQSGVAGDTVGVMPTFHNRGSA